MTAAVGSRLFAIWVTALYPDVDHAVTDEEMAARNAERRGEYRAVCGSVFLPAPDARPPALPCPGCAQVWVQAMVPTQERPGHSHGARDVA